MAWYCHTCSNRAMDWMPICPSCGLPRAKSSRAAGPPVPEPVAIDQCRRLMETYSRWTEDVGVQQVLNLRVEPPGAAEPNEMKQLLEKGWVRLSAGHFQREIEPQKIMIFENGKTKHWDKASNRITK